MAARTLVTFDLFSTLIDSRTGGSAAFARIAAARGWELTGLEVYDRWDARNKQAQRDCRSWGPYATLARQALLDTYRECGLDGDVAVDIDHVLDALPEWPLWPDVDEALSTLNGRYRVGVLSNVDDGLFRRTQAATRVDPEFALTSERLQAYKPAAEFYHRAQEAAGPLVHVASSARDVRGALEAGLDVVRVRRSGHGLDPQGPLPAHEADDLTQLAEHVGRLTAGS